MSKPDYKGLGGGIVLDLVEVNTSDCLREVLQKFPPDTLCLVKAVRIAQIYQVEGTAEKAVGVIASFLPGAMVLLDYGSFYNSPHLKRPRYWELIDHMGYILTQLPSARLAVEINAAEVSEEELAQLCTRASLQNVGIVAHIDIERWLTEEAARQIVRQLLSLKPAGLFLTEEQLEHAFGLLTDGEMPCMIQSKFGHPHLCDLDPAGQAAELADIFMGRSRVWPVVVSLVRGGVNLSDLELIDGDGTSFIPPDKLLGEQEPNKETIKNLIELLTELAKIM